MRTYTEAVLRYYDASAKYSPQKFEWTYRNLSDGSSLPENTAARYDFVFGEYLRRRTDPEGVKNWKELEGICYSE